MRTLPLHKPVESFWFFNGLFLILTGLFFAGAILFWSFGGWGVWVSVFCAFAVFVAIYAFVVERYIVRVRCCKASLCDHPSRRIRVLVFSDLHAGSGWPQTDAWMRRLVDRLRRLKPDLCLFAGDAVVADSADASALSFFSDLSSEYGCYAVLGNHDYLDDPQTVERFFRQAGWTLLSGTCVTLPVQGAEVRLYGASDAVFGDPSASLNQDPLDSAPHLILSHHPESALDALRDFRSLIFCGHTHGGQICFPFFGPLHIPSRLGRAVRGGSCRIRGIQMFVSKGLGTVGIKARLGVCSEVVVVDISI